MRHETPITSMNSLFSPWERLSAGLNRPKADGFSIYFL